jgi:hypothetical protein
VLYKWQTARATVLRNRVADPHHFMRIRIFRLHKDPDFAPHQIDANLRPKVKIKFSL